MTRSELVKKSILLIPSIAIMFGVIILLAKILLAGSNHGALNISEFIRKIISPDSVRMLIKTIPLFVLSIVFSFVFALLFSLPGHGRAGDMWFSLLHGVILCMPVFLFFFLVLLLFSSVLKLVPSGGIYDELSYIAPAFGLAFFFALYLSFKVRYHKSVDIKLSAGNFKKTLFYVFFLFSQECGIFMSLLLVTEFFFYSGGIGYELGQGIRSGNFLVISIIFLYSCLVFIITRYLFSLFAFFTYKRDE